jgi:hypothetical protein
MVRTLMRGPGVWRERGCMGDVVATHMSSAIVFIFVRLVSHNNSIRRLPRLGTPSPCTPSFIKAQMVDAGGDHHLNRSIHVVASPKGMSEAQSPETFIIIPSLCKYVVSQTVQPKRESSCIRRKCAHRKASMPRIGACFAVPCVTIIHVCTENLREISLIFFQKYWHVPRACANGCSGLLRS